MAANCNVTPLLKNFFNYYRFDLTNFDPPLPKFHRCNLLHYTCVKWYFRSMQIWLDIFDPPTKILWMHFVMLHHSCSTNRHPAAPDTTKTTCYRSAAQCWKAFLVQSYYKTGICFWSETFRTLYSAALLILNPTRKPVGFMQSCCPMQTTCMLLDDVWTTSRLGPRQILAWVAQFYAVLHPASCACHPHVVHTCHPHVSSAHIICTCHLHMHIIHMHTCHLHIICSTPDGQHGPKLYFYSDRNWLLNGICRNNVELFHFRII